jgi:uncharacterized protein involved in exopolysaccharide biosynthesis
MYELIRGLEFLAEAGRQKFRLLIFTFGGGTVFLLISLLLPNQYTAVTVILPPQQTRSTAYSLLGQLGDLGSVVAPNLVRNPSALYITLLESHTVADRLVDRFGLADVYSCRWRSKCRAGLKRKTSIHSFKDGSISVEVDDGDAQRAAALANGYVEELVRLNQNLAIGEAKQRRLFFEDQLKNASDKLHQAEEALRESQKSTGVVQLDAQARVFTAAAAQLRAEIAGKQLELDEMRKFATADNPTVVRSEHVLQAMASRLAQLETGSPETRSQVTSGRMAEVGIELVRRTREVKYREAVFEMLAKQLELAHLDEAKNGAFIQVLDRADAPDRKNAPHRILLILVGIVLGFLAGFLFISAGKSLERWRQDPILGEHVEILRQTLMPFRRRNSETSTHS